jgi:hypothetical protein
LTPVWSGGPVGTGPPTSAKSTKGVNQQPYLLLISSLSPYPYLPHLGQEH